MPATLALCATLAAVLPVRADNPLRYRFQPGRQLTYEYRQTVTSTGSDSLLQQATDQVHILCLQRQAGEAYFLLNWQRTVDSRPQPTAGALLYCDNAGRRRLPPETSAQLTRLDPALDLLPMLPLGAEADAVWATPPDHFGRQWRYTSRGPDTTRDGHLLIEFALEGPRALVDLLGHSRSGRLWFDPTGGCVSRFEAEEVDRRGQHRTQVVATLQQTAIQTSAWTARRVEEANRFLRASRHEERLLADVALLPEELPRTLAQLDKLWTGFRTDTESRSNSPFLALADGRRQQVHVDSNLLQTRAKVGLRWMNQPARPWSLQNPAGQTLMSETVRAGVVIECFWSFESVSGLRVLESCRGLQVDRGPNAVRVICYNMDNDVELARRLIAEAGEGLTHILAGPLQDAETLPEFPVVRVVDRQGLIRGVWIGWQPDYPAARELARRLAGP